MLETANQTIQEADALIAKVQRDLDEGAEFFRANNINRDKVMDACAPFISAKDKAEMERAAKEDFEAIEQEVREGMARISFAAGAGNAAGVRKTRAMI